MTSDDPLGIIELGNKKIKCIIFKIIDNNIEILSSSIKIIVYFEYNLLHFELLK